MKTPVARPRPGTRPGHEPAFCFLRCGRTARATALALLISLSAAFARAAVPEPEAEPQASPESAADSSGFLPRWLHMHASVGLGWISSPPFVRQRYQAGQGYEAGLEARPRSSLRLQLNGEYQVLPAVGRATYQIVTQDFEGGEIRDTLALDWLGRGWLGSARVEAQWRALPHTWLLAGAGRGYLEAGVTPYHVEHPNITLDVVFPGSSGWAWIGTLGACYEFELFGPKLAVETRWSLLDRPQDQLETWSIRIGWRGK